MIDYSIGVMPPKDDDTDVLYLFLTNKERNIIATAIFSKHVDEAHPLVKQGDRDYSVCKSIPRYTIILKSLIESKQ